MPVILLERDPFVEAEAQLINEAVTSDYNIRRPLYGTIPKGNHYGSISLYQDAGGGEGLVPISLHDSSAPGGKSHVIHNFTFQVVSEQRQEKSQIVETFGDHFVFFYGEKPIILTVQGILINTADFNWKNEWLRNYDQFLRGTKCVETKSRIFLSWDDRMAQGYILNCSIQTSSDSPYMCPFSFTMLLAKPPVDLSNVADLSAEYGSMVTKAEEARTMVSTGELVEYLTPTKAYDVWEINEIGQSVKAAESSQNVPATVDNPRTADWITGNDPVGRQWMDSVKALQEINVQITAAGLETDVVTIRRHLRANAAKMPLTTRNAAVEMLALGLGSGVSNVGAVIPPPIALES